MQEQLRGARAEAASRERETREARDSMFAMQREAKRTDQRANALAAALEAATATAKSTAKVKSTATGSALLIEGLDSPQELERGAARESEGRRQKDGGKAKEGEIAEHKNAVPLVFPNRRDHREAQPIGRRALPHDSSLADGRLERGNLLDRLLQPARALVGRAAELRLGQRELAQLRGLGGRGREESGLLGRRGGQQGEQSGLLGEKVGKEEEEKSAGESSEGEGEESEDEGSGADEPITAKPADRRRARAERLRGEVRGGGHSIGGQGRRGEREEIGRR